MTITLYRAADDDIVVGCASFAEDLESARAYLSNPGFGGRTLYSATVDVDDGCLLDLTAAGDPIAILMDRAGIERHPGAIGADEWAPRISYELREAGVEWVRVRESYPADTITWIFVGQDDPEMEEIG